MKRGVHKGSRQIREALPVHEECLLGEQGGSTPSEPEQRQFIDRHRFWKLNGSLLGMLTKEGQKTDPTKAQISQGTEKKYHGRNGGWMEKRKKSYFHSMASELLGLANRTQTGPELRKPISYHWRHWVQSCQLSGAHIGPQGLILSHSVPGSETICSKWVSLPSQGLGRAVRLKLLLVSSLAGFYKVLFSGKGGIREILKQ
jgi:hypothetical protein